MIVPAKSAALIKTDIALEFPDNCYGHITSRSGLALKKFIHVGGGVIDADYRGNIGIILFNHSEVNYTVKIGDRVAQIIFQKIKHPKFEEAQNFDDMNKTKRGDAGFGSSGL